MLMVASSRATSLPFNQMHCPMGTSSAHLVANCRGFQFTAGVGEGARAVITPCTRYRLPIVAGVHFYVYIGRCEEVDTVADLLDTAVERVGDSVEEIDDPLGHLRSGALQ